jgi:hypothetical protein
MVVLFILMFLIYVRGKSKDDQDEDELEDVEE